MSSQEKFGVSLIIPVYNVKKFLPQLFKNINQQMYDNFEVIFIDDGSTDGSSDLLDEECLQINNFNVIHQKNFGTGYSRNVGIKNARGKYIFFMDPDDTMHDRLLLDNLKVIEDSKADIVVFGFDTVNDHGEILDTKRYSSMENRLNGHSVPTHFNELYEQLVFHALWHKLIRKDFIIDNHIESPLWSNSQDRGLIMKLALYNPNIIFNFNNIGYYNYVLMREGASTAKFKNNLTSIGFQLSSCVEDIIMKFNILRTRKLMYEVYIQDVYGYTGVTNVLRENGPVHFRQKVKYINKIYSNEAFNENAFSGEYQAHDLGFKEKWITFFVKHKMTNLILFLKIIEKRLKSKP